MLARSPLLALTGSFRCTILFVRNSAALVPYLFALGCSGERSDHRESEAQAALRAPLTAEEAALQANILSFEQAGLWTIASGSATVEQSAIASHGQASLQVSSFGYVLLQNAVPLKKEGAVPSVVGYDIRVPAEPLDPWWAGDTQLYIDAPSAGLWSQYLGIRSLQGFPAEQFQRVEFELPGWMQDALEAVNFQDLTFRIAINVTPNNGTYWIDRFTLGPDPGPGECTPEDDDNPCTIDSCDPATGQTTHTPVPAGISCADANVCNGQEVCSGDGVCLPGTPLEAGESTPCLSVWCDPVLGVQQEPRPAGTPCSDGNVCNGVELCDGAGNCEPGVPPDLEDGNPCTVGSCDPELGVVQTPVAAGTPCSDGNACNGMELCDGVGSCQAGTPPNLESENPCIVLTCDPVAGVIESPAPDGTACDDGNACTQTDACQAGVCVGTNPIVCSTAGPCQAAGECDPAMGACTGSPLPDGTPCDDGDACSQTDVCQAGQCIGTNPVVCVAQSQCHEAGSCDPATGQCTSPMKADGSPCSDDNACTVGDSCQAGTCVAGTPVTIEEVPCQVGSCDPATGAITYAAVADGTPCDDGDACSQTDVCQAGQCVGTNPVVCVAQSQCHEAGSCDPATGQCTSPMKADGTPCDDGDPCTTGDYCAAGTCVSGDEVVVEEQPCQVGFCDAATGGIVYDPVPDGTPCDDGNACSQTDICQAGACVGTDPVVCGSGPCHTGGSCDPATGVCSGEALPDGTSCDDGDPCTVNDTCSGGVCVAGATPVIEERPCQVGFCDPTTGAVVYEPAPEGTACFVDSCSQGVCNAEGECVAVGPPPVVDDGNACTIDRCDPVLGPVHVPCGEVDRTVATTVLAATEWIFSGPNPIQTGVAPGTIEARRAALIRGFVRTRDGTPLPNVQITVHGHPELGQTTTHADGTFDLVVNGGGRLQVDFHKPGYLDVARPVDARWNHTHVLDEVVLIEPDPIVTEIDLDPSGTDYQVAVGSLITDDDGTRQATLLFPPGVQALMHLPNGNVELMDQMHVRITEFTVGDDGPAAMPAILPPNTGYTYAFEVNADEAVAAGAPEIEFSEPLVFYTDNFLGFPAGTAVPLGSFDRQQGVWIPHDNGIVMNVLPSAGGLADIDLTNDGVPETAAQLAQHGITDDEREQLALLYPNGASLWRVNIPHFTQPYDCNWPFHFPEDAEAPNAGEPVAAADTPDSCEVANASFIDCHDQTYREQIPVGGTPFSLSYSSDRVPGRTDLLTVNIPLTTSSVPASLKRVDVSVEVAGRKLQESFPPSPDQMVTFTWDGLDAYGRKLQGRQRALIRVSYAYDGVYGAARRFGNPGTGVQLTGSRTRQELFMTRTWEVTLGAWEVVDSGLGGWSLSVHHSYDPGTSQLFLGDGTMRSADVITPVVVNYAGEFPSGLNEGGLARRATVVSPSGVAVGPDGSVYFCDDNNASRLRRVSPDGIITTIAGTGVSGFSGDGGPNGGPATQAQIRCALSSLGMAPDGSLYLAEPHNSRVRRISPDGIITTVAGTGVPGYSGDGGPATEAQINVRLNITIAVGPDGSIFIADRGANRIRQVTPDGIINTIAGTGTVHPVPPADGTPALQANFEPAALAVDAAGTLYVLAEGAISDPVYSLGADGRLRHIAGCRMSSDCASLPPFDVPARLGRWFQGGSGGRLAVSPDGEVTIFAHVDSFNGSSGARRILTIDPDGIVRTRAGEASGQPYRSGAPAAQVNLGQPFTGAFGPRGLVFSEQALGPRVTGIESALPGMTTGGETVVPSADGNELYVFDEAGRHLRTLHALTFGELYRFDYDSSGRLTAIHDESGKTTHIERDSQGRPTAIVSPYGQRTTLTLNDDGYLATVTTPESETYAMSYYEDGLLASFTNPRGGMSTMTYDELGRITVDEDAVSAPLSFTRTDHSGGWTVTKRTALGRTTQYRIDRHLDGSDERTNTFPDGTQSVVQRDASGSFVSTMPDGTEIEVRKTADPRWGITSPITSTITRLPSGLERVETVTRTIAPTNLSNPADLTSQTDTTVVNGRTYRTVYTASTRRFTTTSPQNRTITRDIDALGRTIRTQVGSLTPIEFTYDSDGRLASITQGSRQTHYGYFGSGPANGMLSSITDALGIVTTMTRDAMGRVLTEARGSATTAFGWDALGNLTSVTPPGQPEHQMSYTPVNLLASYAPPPLSAADWSTQYAWDLDRQLTTEARPDGTLIEYFYDDAGRLVLTTSPTGNVQRAYYGPEDTCAGCAPGRLAAITGPYGVELTFGYDGQLKTSESWNGAVAGDVAWSYNANFVATSETVFDASSAQSVFFGYDNDLLLTCASPTSCSPVSADALRLTRHAQHGLVTQLLQGTMTENWTYNTFGELASQVVTAGGTPLIAFEYHTASAPRDALGRIVEKAETFGGTTRRIGYTYDVLGRLTDVTIDGAFAEHYEYDLNGNRLLGQTPEGSFVGTYDDQDRLLSYGDLEFTYGANGELFTKTDTSTQETTAYTYDAFGNLIAVELPDGRLIEYVTDGKHRRVGKKIDGVLVKQWLYRDQLNPVAELDGAGNIVARFVYGSRRHVPDFAMRDGAVYRIISDQIGSVRMVVNVDDASDVLFRAEYSAFGEMTLLEGDVEATPFGFAGGIFDVDTGLTRFGARDYDPDVARWTAKDPIRQEGDGPNFYGYALMDPVNAIDPEGLRRCTVCNVTCGILTGICATTLWETGPGLAVCAGVLASCQLACRRAFCRDPSPPPGPSGPMCFPDTTYSDDDHGGGWSSDR